MRGGGINYDLHYCPHLSQLCQSHGSCGSRRRQMEWRACWAAFIGQSYPCGGSESVAVFRHQTFTLSLAPLSKDAIGTRRLGFVLLPLHSSLMNDGRRPPLARYLARYLLIAGWMSYDSLRRSYYLSLKPVVGFLNPRRFPPQRLTLRTCYAS